MALLETTCTVYCATFSCNTTFCVRFFRSDVRHRRLHEPEVIAMGDEEMSGEEVTSTSLLYIFHNTYK